MRGVAVLLVTIAAVAATDCPPNWPPEQLLPHEDCHKYYQCVWGKKVEMICPEDLYFNDATWQCDWQANVQCGDRNPPGECTTTTTPAPTTTPTPCNQTDPTTTTTPEPTTTPTTTPPTTPTTTPTTTTTTTPAPTTTPPPCSTDPVTPSTGTTPTTAITPPPDGFLSNGCPVNPHVHWLLPVPGCCNSFYYCVWGQLVQRSCPPSLHFNTRIQVCDWPWSAGCA